ncbi:MAG: O-antigen ligase family protein [Chloroflexia bacterium]
MLLIVAGVLLVSAYLGPRASTRYLVLLIGAGLALAFLQRPALGLAALMVAGPLVPFAVGTGTQTDLNTSVLLAGLLTGLWILCLLLGRQRLFLSRPARPLLGLCLVAILAFIGGQIPWIPFAQPAPLRAQLGGLAVFLLSAGVFLFAAHQVSDVRWLARLTWIFLGLGALYVIGRIVPPLGSLAVPLFQQGSTGSLFWTWLSALAFAQAVFNRRLHPLWRLVLSGLVLATLYVGLFQSRWWASGWLPPLVAMVAILWAGAPRWGLLTTLAGSAVALLNLPAVINLLMVGDQEYSLITRAEAWRIVAEIVKVNPVLGLGPANYYHYTPLFPILGWYVNFSSHNQYVDLVAQTGLLGLACFLWFVWEAGRLGWRLRKEAPAGFAQAYVYGTFGGLVGTAVAGLLADWVLPFVYNIGLAGFRASIMGWLFLGGMCALERSGTVAAALGKSMPSGSQG